MFGEWKINVVVDAMPQKVATAVSELSEKLMGAEYRPIAYLGSQVVNGINSAVLAEQTIITGRDTKNVVVITFNEKPGDMKLTLVGIDRIVESGAPIGGIVIDVKTEIPDDAMTAWKNAFEGYVGAKVEPFALLGTQLVNGTNYIFAATFEGVTLNPTKKVVIVTLNTVEKRADIADMLDSKQNASLGYAFTW